MFLSQGEEHFPLLNSHAFFYLYLLCIALFLCQEPELSEHQKKRMTLEQVCALFDFFLI